MQGILQPAALYYMRVRAEGDNRKRFSLISVQPDQAFTPKNLFALAYQARGNAVTIGKIEQMQITEKMIAAQPEPAVQLDFVRARFDCPAHRNFAVGIVLFGGIHIRGRRHGRFMQGIEIAHILVDRNFILRPGIRTVATEHITVFYDVARIRQPVE